MLIRYTLWDDVQERFFPNSVRCEVALIPRCCITIQLA